MAKNSQIKTKAKSIKTENSSKGVESKNSIWDILKFGESYTSLILGIIVVIISTIILITFVKGKENITRLTDERQAAIKNTQETTNKLATQTKQNLLKNAQINPTIIAKNPVSDINTKKAAANYTVVEGDTLWSIAERKYKSGYNWVDIQNANNLSNANLLYVGQKLTLPNVSAKVATVIESIKSNKIARNDYIVIKGDTLWDIAVRAYGDGYAWPKIASANKLINPGVIHSGNRLSIPRG